MSEPICTTCCDWPAATLIGLSVCVLCAGLVPPPPPVAALTLPPAEVAAMLRAVDDALAPGLFKASLSDDDRRHLDIAASRLAAAIPDDEGVA